MTRPVKIGLQGGFSAALIFAVLWKADLGHVADALAGISPRWFLLSLLATAFATLVMVERWRLLLVARGRREPGFGWLCETYLISLLLGQVLPTAIGGDAARAIYLGRRTGDKTEAWSSVLVDRLVGLAALGVLAVVGVVAGGGGIGRGVAALVLVGVLGGSALAAWLLLSPTARPLVARLPLASLTEAIHAYRAHRAALAQVFALGLVAQSARVLSIAALAHGMSLPLSVWSLFVLCPVLFLVTIIPVSLNGIGLREATFVVVLAGVGVTREDALALGLAFFAVGVLAASFGGIAMLRRALGG